MTVGTGAARGRGEFGAAGRGDRGAGRGDRGRAGRGERAGRLGDGGAVTVALLLVAAAAVVGAWLRAAGRPVGVEAAPLFARLAPHVGPGTPFALAVAGLAVRYGPALAARLPRGRLLGLAYLASLGWTVSLALVDGWRRGLAGRLATPHEYLSEVGGVTDVPAMLRGFTGRILDGPPDAWTTHVAGHPPGALLVFVALDRIGLGGGGWAAAVCVAVGTSATVSVALALWHLAGEPVARAAVPFLVLFPGAVWVGVSADGLFTGVAAAGIAALAVAGRRPGVPGWVAAFAGGVLLGSAGFLSYGLVLLAPVAVAVLVVARRWTPLPAVALGAAAVVAGFAAAGFWWLDGYHLVVQRYYQGIASHRPYSYWVWADLACLVACAGPAAAPALRRAVVAVAGPTWRSARAAVAGPTWRSARPRWALLPVAAAVAVLAADLSGLSKAEVERIWLPFAVWLVAGAALLPSAGRRGWLAAQAATALAVNHALLTGW